MAARRKERSFFEHLYENFAQHFSDGIPPMEPMEPMGDMPPMGEQPFGFVSDIREWMSQLGRNALPRFGIFMISHGQCEQPVGQRSACANRAVAECVVCGLPTCLFHGFINHEATLVCEGCASWAERRVPKKKRMKQQAREAPPPRPQYRAPRTPNYDPERVQALMQLGLPPTATFADVQTRFRELAAKLHPDKFPENERKQAGEKFARITAAYETLKAKAA